MENHTDVKLEVIDRCKVGPHGRRKGRKEKCTGADRYLIVETKVSVDVVSLMDPNIKIAGGDRHGARKINGNRPWVDYCPVVIVEVERIG